MNINYKSDFVLIIEFDDGIPTTPWRIRFSTLKPSCTTPSGSYTALFDGVNYLRAHPLEDSTTQIVVEFTNHGLPAGTLQGEWQNSYPNVLFESGEQLVVMPKITEINLVEGAGDDSIDPEIWAIVSPIIVGEPELPTTLTNSAVDINETGINLNAAIDGDNNVLGGLLASISLKPGFSIEKSWIHPSLGEDAYFSISYSTTLRMTTVKLINSTFAESAYDYYALYNQYQASVNANSYTKGEIQLYYKTASNVYFYWSEDSTYHPGLTLLIFSNAQFYEPTA